jgi:CRISPR-associated protein Csy1
VAHTDFASPKTAAEWVALGQRHLAASAVAQAAASFKRATALEPQVAMHWARLGKVQAAMRQHEAAEAAFARACALEPLNPALQVLLAGELREQNKAEEAIDACVRAVKAAPDNIPAAVTRALMLPPVYAGLHDLERWRERYIDGLARLQAKKAVWLSQPHGVLGVEATNFYLAYQGKDDLALQSSYSDFLGPLLGAAVPDLQAPLELRGDRSRRIRVGFLSSNLKASTIGDYFGGWISELPRDRFELHGVLAAGIPDPRTEVFARASDNFVSVDGTADEIAQRVKFLALDILVFLDAGMTPWGNLLANLRLAPVQCAAWGHPVTTGSTFVDYYLSCADMEPEDAAGHYRERLVLLPGLGTRYRPAPHVENAERAEFGLPAHKHLYLCPQSLFKIHPDTDALLLELLARDEDAVLVFFAATTRGQREAFVRRLETGMKMRGLPPHHQIKLLPPLSHIDFRRVMTVADVMLDTLHWSGGGTSLDALATGLPVVTLPGRLMRGRQSAAMLRIIGVEELIASDPDQYVALALRVANDREYRARLSSRIRDGLPRLFDRPEPADALAAALENMVSPQSS